MTGVILSDASQNPYTNTGTITGDAYGIIAQYITGVNWNVTNAFGGTITTTGKYGDGVILPGGTTGTFTNNGDIYAQGLYGNGVIVGNGTVNNYEGYIFGGFLGDGVVLTTGTVINGRYIYGGAVGVSVQTGTVLNQGQIHGTVGVDVAAGGRVVNGVAGNSVANLFSSIYGATGVEITDHTGSAQFPNSTIANYGAITATARTSSDAGLYIDGNAAVVNGGPNNHKAAAITCYGGDAIREVNGGANVYNYGVITSDTQRAVSLASGFLDNIHGAIGGGGGGVYIGVGRLTNEGTINGGSQFGIDLGSGNVTNHGRVYGNDHGVTLAGAGVVGNYGTIIGGTQSSSTYFDGVKLAGGGTLINRGLIEGPTGVHITGGTLVNAGTIDGVGGDAVVFYGYNNRLILDATSQLNGAALAVLDPSNVLELAATGAHGSVALTGLGSSIAGFQTVDVDSGAKWTLTGANTSNSETIELARGGTLTLSGQLANVGPMGLGDPTSGSGGEIVVSGSLSTDSLSMAGQDTVSVTATGTVQVGTGSGAHAGRVTVMHDGTIIGSGTIAGGLTDRGVVIASGGDLTVTGNLTGAGSATILSKSALTVDGALQVASVVFGPATRETLKLGSPDTCTAVISGFAATDAIDLLNTLATGDSFSGGVLTVTGAGGTTLASLNVSGSYQTGNFVLGTDNHGGTLITFKVTSPTPSEPPQVQAFVSAMAGLAGAASTSVSHAADSFRAPAMLLSTPHMSLS